MQIGPENPKNLQNIHPAEIATNMMFWHPVGFCHIFRP